MDAYRNQTGQIRARIDQQICDWSTVALEKDMSNSWNRKSHREYENIYVYGASDPVGLSGSPFYFMSSLSKLTSTVGTYVKGIPLKRTREIPFTYLKFLSKHFFQKDGFLWSSDYHDASLKKQNLNISKNSAIISFTQSISPILIEKMRLAKCDNLYFYMDATYKQLFDNFYNSLNLTEELKGELLCFEQELYSLAKRIFVYDMVTKVHLQKEYGLEEKRVCCIGRGVNLSNPEYRSARQERLIYLSSTNKIVNLCFVGRDAKRKGLFELIDSIDSLAAEERGLFSLTVIGPEPDQVPKRSYLECTGFLGSGKRNEVLKLMARSDIGILLSSAEGVPGSIFEFQTLGVPCWITWLPQYMGLFDDTVNFIENLPLRQENLINTLRQILSYKEKGLLKGRVMGESCESWNKQAEIVLSELSKDREIEFTNQ